MARLLGGAAARRLSHATSRPYLHPLRVGARARRWHDVASPGRLGDRAASSSELPSPLRYHARILHKQPLAAAASTAFATAAIGDCLAQLVWTSGVYSAVEAAIPSEMGMPTAALAAMATMSSAQPLPGVDPELGWQRTLRFAGIVGALVGVAGESWFRRLLRPFPGWTYDVALRTTFDQALFAPAVLSLVVGGTTYIASGGDVHYTRHKLHHDCAQALSTMWTWWLSGISFSYLMVPTLWQPAFAMSWAIGWTAHVSSRVHRPTDAGPRPSDRIDSIAAYLREAPARDA